MFIPILYMFRTPLCSSSGESIISIRHLVFFLFISQHVPLQKAILHAREMLLVLALGNNLTVMSTQFQHKEIHKGSWLAPDQMTLNQIEHVLITSKKKELIEDVRSMRGPNIYSDQYLLKIIVNQKHPKK
jgi:hypothetical protein